MKKIVLILCLLLSITSFTLSLNNYFKLDQVNENTTYNALNYGISSDNQDNTKAMQALIELVHHNGGGTIYVPNGIYQFNSDFTSEWSNYHYTLLCYDDVSIIGESRAKTVFKQNNLNSLFYYQGNKDNPLQNVSFKNFSVDAYDSGNENVVYAKAFFFQYVKDATFEDLTLKGTSATALGIDFLDQVLIENVITIDCGRTYTGSESGSSGIGIGSGGWDNENFIINNCITINSGQYGIFIENQYDQGWSGHISESKGMIISNCIVRNGKNKGIGIRGASHVNIHDNLIYENNHAGIYLDSNCSDILITNNQVLDNGIGLCLETSDISHDITSINNQFLRNKKHPIINTKATNLNLDD